MNNYLSPEQRLTIYKKMLIRLKDGNSIGFCETAKAAVEKLGLYTDGFSIKEDLPELIKYKPELFGRYWFPTDAKGISKRIKILEEIIVGLETTSTVPKEITSVKTKQNYYLGFDFIPAGTPGIKHKNEGWKWDFQNGCMIKSESFIRENRDWFDFEENSPIKEFILEDFTYKSTNNMNSELNRLTKWCNDQYNPSINNKTYFVVLEKNEFIVYGKQVYDHMGIKFNSYQSAELFITELSKPQNISYKNYFIGLIKQPYL